MPKLIVKTFDDKREYKIDSAKIITPLYKTKIKEKQVHSPSTAMFVAKSDNLGYEFILYHPLIESDAVGDITIYTDKTFAEILVSDQHINHSKDYKTNKLSLKALEGKMKIGATIEEVWKFEDYKNRVETGKILRKYKFYKLIGGVK